MVPESRLQRASEGNRRRNHLPSEPSGTVFFLNSPCSSAASSRCSRFLSNGVGWYIRAGCIPVFLLIITQWPRAVILNRKGISKHSFVALRNTISWPDVTALSYERCRFNRSMQHHLL